MAGSTEAARHAGTVAVIMLSIRHVAMEITKGFQEKSIENEGVAIFTSKASVHTVTIEKNSDDRNIMKR